MIGKVYSAFKDGRTTLKQGEKVSSLARLARSQAGRMKVMNETISEAASNQVCEQCLPSCREHNKKKRSLTPLRLLGRPQRYSLVDIVFFFGRLQAM